MTTLTRLVWPDPFSVDAAGVPRAGAKLYFYASGSNTPQPTYQDSGGMVANSNPIVADEGGQFGAVFCVDSPAYRVVLEDANGATIWVEDPVTGVNLTAVTAAIAAETARAETAEAALQTALTAETVRAETAEAALQTAITAETARAEAAEAAITASIGAIKSGTGVTDAGGTATITYGAAFAAATDAVQVTINIAPEANKFYGLQAPLVLGVTAAGFTVHTVAGLLSAAVPRGGTNFYWMATGH